MDALVQILTSYPEATALAVALLVGCAVMAARELW